MAVSILIKREIIRVMKRFKFVEFERAVMPIFPELSWSNVKSKLVKNHKSFTVTNVVQIIEEAVNTADISKNDLKDRLATLEVIDISRHKKNNIWYGYKLTSKMKSINYVKNQEVEESIQKECRMSNLNVLVKTITHNNVLFVCIKEIKKKVRLSKPIFFALLLRHKYFFASKDISPDLIKIISIILGYKNGKRIMLMGKDLQSLIKMLWMEEQGVLNAANLNHLPVYKTPKPLIKATGIDYTQTKQRKEYIEKCFSKDPPILEKLVIKGPSISLEHPGLASILPTNSIHMSWEFRSNNIANLLTNLVEKRIFTSTLPHYVINLMLRGRNELTLQATT